MLFVDGYSEFLMKWIGVGSDLNLKIRGLWKYLTYLFKRSIKIANDIQATTSKIKNVSVCFKFSALKNQLPFLNS